MKATHLSYRLKNVSLRTKVLHGPFFVVVFEEIFVICSGGILILR